jgi:hypothetical protein
MFVLKIIIMLLIGIIIYSIINSYMVKEKFGVYCGSYNLDKSGDAETLCKGNSECQWNSYTEKNGNVSGWCGDHGRNGMISKSNS